MTTKCAAPHCDCPATTNSAFCLPHAIEAGGAMYLVSTLPRNLLPDIYYPDPVTPPAGLHERLMAKVKAGVQS